MHLKIDPPKNGLISVTLSSFGEAVMISAINTPYDSVTELSEGLFAILEGKSEVMVRWDCQFNAYDFFFVTYSKRIILSIIEFPHTSRPSGAGKVLFKINGNKLEMCLSVWYGLRRLEKLLPSKEDYKSIWGHSFPSENLEKIAKKILKEDPLVLRL